MALNNYVLATVKVLISSRNQDLIGDDSLQALCELFYAGKLDIYSVNPSLRDVLKEGDLVLVDVGLANIPNTNQDASKNEIIKIIRNDTRKRIENLYKDLATRVKTSPPRSGDVV